MHFPARDGADVVLPLPPNLDTDPTTVAVGTVSSPFLSNRFFRRSNFSGVLMVIRIQREVRYERRQSVCLLMHVVSLGVTLESHILSA